MSGPCRLALWLNRDTARAVREYDARQQAAPLDYGRVYDLTLALTGDPAAASRAAMDFEAARMQASNQQ